MERHLILPVGVGIVNRQSFFHQVHPKVQLRKPCFLCSDPRIINTQSCEEGLHRCFCGHIEPDNDDPVHILREGMGLGILLCGWSIKGHDIAFMDGRSQIGLYTDRNGPA